MTRPRILITSAAAIDPTVSLEATRPTHRGVAFVLSWFGIVVDLTVSRRAA